MLRIIKFILFFSILPLYAPDDPHYVIFQWGLMAEYTQKVDVEIEALIQEGRALLNSMDFPMQVMIGESSLCSTIDKLEQHIKEKKYLRDHSIKEIRNLIIKYPHVRKHFLSIKEGE